MPRDTAVICDVCGVKINRKQDLKRHKQLHAPDDEALQYHCIVDGCGKSFRQYSNFKNHKNTHTGTRPYQCPDCASRYSDPSSRTRHRKEKHGYVPPPRAKFQGVATISENDDTADGESDEDGSFTPEMDDPQAVDDDETDHPTAEPSLGLPTEESHD